VTTRLIRADEAKGIIIRLLSSIFSKAHAIQISDRKHLTGSFNSHLMN